jgi:hypothetical protein
LPDAKIGPTGKCSEIDPEICRLMDRWERITERKGDDPIQKIIKHWSERPRQPLENWPPSEED